MRMYELNEAAAIRKISRQAAGSMGLKNFLRNSLDEIMRAFVCDAGFFRLNTAPEKSFSFLSKGFSRKTASQFRNTPEKSFVKNKTGALNDALVEDGFQYFALHPIHAENHVVGYLGLARKEGEIAKPGDFFNVCLEIIGIAITKAWLREQSDKLQDDLVALQGVNKITSHGFNMDDITQRIVVHGKRLVKNSHCHLFLVDDQREYLDVMASTQADASIRSLRFRIADLPVIIKDAMQKRRGIAIENPEKHYIRHDIPTESLRWHSIIIAPLLTQDNIIGALVCSDETAGRRFTDNEVLRTEMLAHQAAITLENARLFQAVSRSQKSWETTFDAMQDCVSVHDTTGKIIRANVALARRLGTTPRAVIGRYCSEIYSTSGSGNGKYCRHMRQHKPEDIVTEELEIPAMKGFFQISVSPWYDKNNQVAGFIHVAKDISNEKQLQQQLIQSEKLSAIGGLISGIAHELNNPLTGVMGYAQLLQLRVDLDGRAKESLSKINDLAIRCQKIVQNLLSFARKKKPERILSDINEILNKTLELRNYEMQVNNIELISELDPELPETIVDAHQLQQVFLNIITNAEQAMRNTRGKGRLTIRTRSNHRKGYITVEIIDNGPGIPEKHRMRVFDPFFTTKDVGKGTGLGLSLSYGIIKEHGGDIFVKSRQGGKKGAHFFIEIPVIRENDRYHAEPHRASSGEQRFDNTNSVRKILVVDDEKYILDFLTEVFRLLPFIVDTAADVQTGLDKIRICEYDLIITDYRMPQMNGKDMFNWVKENRPSLVSRIVFMTGDTVNPETHSFFTDNRIRYLTKPFKIEEIKDMVMQTLEAGNQ